MAKISAKDGIVLINGYNLSTYTTAYEAQEGVDVIDVTGLSDTVHNAIPGDRTANLTLNMLWDNSVDVPVLITPGNTVVECVTLIPEGYSAVGDPSLSLPYTQANFNPAGNPGSAIGLGAIQFVALGDSAGLENGVILQYGNITNTTSTSSVRDESQAAQTCECAATLHVYTACATDTYEVKVEDSANDVDWDTLLTFTLDGSAVGSERISVASGTVNQYRRVTATRTGAAGNTFGFAVHFWRDPTVYAEP